MNFFKAYRRLIINLLSLYITLWYTSCGEYANLRVCGRGFDVPRLSRQPIRFGIFEIDLRAGELRRRGLKINLQPQPFQILASLLERSGEVVTLEELRRKIWPADTFVNFNSSMRTAINRIRQALGDSGRSPRFIETLSRRGCRFIMPTRKLFEARQAFGERQPERVRLAVLPSTIWVPLAGRRISPMV